MSNCCQESHETQSITQNNNCPLNGKQGKIVSLTTLKSLLIPTALVKLNANAHYRFCESEDCPVVYFAEDGQVFNTEQLKVPVFQKEQNDQVPVCYCFDWTRERINQQKKRGGEDAIAMILEQIQAKRCGCEFNNPQGRCCLANVRSVINR